MNKTIKNTLFATTFIAMGAAGISIAKAAVDGATGATSVGNLIVSLVIDNKLKVSNLDDVNLGTFAGGNLNNNDTFCVFYNQTAPYQITFDSNDVPGTFELTDGVNNIPYAVTYDDGVNGVTPVTAGVAIVNRNSQGNDAATGANDDCVTLTFDNGTVDLTALAVDITGNPNGTYTEQLNITVAPSI